MATLHEDFSSYDLGELGGQGDWICESGEIDIVKYGDNKYAEVQTDAASYYRPIPQILYTKYHGTTSLYPPYKKTNLLAIFCPTVDNRDNNYGYGIDLNRTSSNGYGYDIRAADSTPHSLCQQYYYDGDITYVDYTINPSIKKYPTFNSTNPTCNAANIDLYTILAGDTENYGFNWLKLIQQHPVEVSEKGIFDDILLEKFDTGNKYNNFPKWRKTSFGMRPTY